MELHTLIQLFLIFISQFTKSGGGVPLSAAEAQSRTAWWSQPFNYECLQECYGETTKRTATEDISILNRNCSVQCKGGSVRHRSFPSKTLKWIRLKNPLNGAKSTCLIQILKEEITCGSLTIRAGVRKFQSDAKNQCQRRNYKYYLPHQICDAGPHLEVGEETCRGACVNETLRLGRKLVSINVARQRAVFRICYRGMVSESGASRRRRENFCRAEMTPCSNCFRWGNWTYLNACSRTCGSPGIRTSIRGCFIMDRTGLYGDGMLWTPMSSTYCREYLGGNDRKTNQCGSYTACPGWTQWGPWSECPSDIVVTSPKDSPSRLDQRKPAGGCRKRVKRDVNTNFTSDLVQNGSGAGEDLLAELQARMKSNAAENIAAELKDGLMTHRRGRKDSFKSRRSRKCLPIGSDDSLCQGNSTQYKSCTVRAKPPIAQPKSETDECENHGNGVSLPTTAKTITEPYATIRARTSYVEGDAASAVVGRHVTTRHHHPGIRGEKNSNDSPGDPLSEDGFTNVINTYAPALIAGLLIFVVLLLAALIAICGARVMQKSRRNRYDVTSQSFSAGTMGSIPSGLVHGFSHVLGLRHGSGTFGRSETAANGIGNSADGMENRGSCRSIASSAASRGRTKQPHTGLHFSSGSTRAGSPHQRIPLTELGKKVDSNMGSKKPSNSSLLSSGSSVSGLPVAPPCPSTFYPLPPLPSNLPPQPVGNEASVFKRGAKKSSSLNPGEIGTKSHTLPHIQPRAESVSGRVNTRQERYTRPHARRSKAKQMSDGSSSDSYCRHNCEHGACDASSDNHEASENEYWTVTRPGCLESDESVPGPFRSSNQNTPIAKPRERRNIMSLQRESPRKNVVKRRSRSAQETEGVCAQVEMIDNVLYAQKKTSSVKEIEDKLDEESLRESTDETEDQPDFQPEGERVYNTIGTEDPDEVSEPESSLATEGEYDHLCDQFGGLHSTKGRMKYPGTMTSLHYLRNSDDDIDGDNAHDYESIDIESKRRPRGKILEMRENC